MNPKTLSALTLSLSLAAFRLAGAEPEILVLRNLDAAGLGESLQALAAALDRKSTRLNSSHIA